MMKDNRGENSVERCISGELSLVVNCPLWCLCLGGEMSLRDRAVKMGSKQGEQVQYVNEMTNKSWGTTETDKKKANVDDQTVSVNRSW